MKNFSVILLISSLLSCSKTPEPVKELGNNSLHQSFYEIGANDFLISQENKIQTFNTDFKFRYQLGSALQIDKNFYQAVGDKNLLCLLTNDGIEIFKKKEKEEAYENVSKLAGIKRCELMQKSGDFLFVGTGISECSSGNLSSKLSIYNITDASKPALVQTININEPKEIKVSKNYIFVSEGSKGIKIYDFNGKDAPKEVLKIEDKRIFNINYDASRNLLFARNPEEIYQYDLTNISKPSLLSTIKIGQ